MSNEQVYIEIFELLKGFLPYVATGGLIKILGIDPRELIRTFFQEVGALTRREWGLKPINALCVIVMAVFIILYFASTDPHLIAHTSPGDLSAQADSISDIAGKIFMLGLGIGAMIITMTISMIIVARYPDK